MNPKNTITAVVRLSNGTSVDILQESEPQKAINSWLFPDSGVPVECLIIDLIDNNGTRFELSITKNEISVLQF
jgi:hypothetical protein